MGQAAFLHLLLDAAAPRPVVPAAAIVDDAGRPIVFVQREGETFERRAVTLGPRGGDLVQIAEGVKPGERVVTKGAYPRPPGVAVHLRACAWTCALTATVAR